MAERNAFFGTLADHVALGEQGLRLAGNATVWDDYMIPGNSVRNGAIAPDLVGGFAGNAGLYTLNFDGVNTVEEVQFTVQMPHRWKQGTQIFPHVHFSPTDTNSGDTNARTVRFTLEYTWASIWGTFGASGTLNLDSRPFVPATSQWQHLLALNPDGIDGTSRTLSSMLICRLYRDPASSADTYPQDVAFLQFDIHHEIDALGSEAEFTKG